MTYRVFVEVSDNYLWTLRPFAHLFNVFWSDIQPVVVAGYTKPEFRLPSNFVFHQIAKTNYPAERWSDGMIKFLNSVNDNFFVFMLCDYWITRDVDKIGVDMGLRFMDQHNNVLRYDLTDDRQFAGGILNIGGWGHYDLVESPHGTPYQMSLQAAIWNRELLLQLLVPGKSAWETEIHLHPPEAMRVVGTRQCPLRYANAILKGEIDKDQLRRLPQSHFDIIRRMIPNAIEL